MYKIKLLILLFFLSKNVLAQEQESMQDINVQKIYTISEILNNKNSFDNKKILIIGQLNIFFEAETLINGECFKIKKEDKDKSLIIRLNMAKDSEKIKDKNLEKYLIQNIKRYKYLQKNHNQKCVVLSAVYKKPVLYNNSKNYSEKDPVNNGTLDFINLVGTFNN